MRPAFALNGISIPTGPSSPLEKKDPSDFIPAMADLLNGINIPKLPSWLERLAEETVAHFRPELACILACELGEKGAEMALFGVGAESWNAWALPAGFAAGLSYAVKHIYDHAQTHGIKPRLIEALKYALSTESGCVVGATTTEWLAGNMADAQSPFDLEALLYSALGLPIAFGVGLSAMSITSLARKNVFNQLVVSTDEVSDRLSDLEDDLHRVGLTLNMKKRVLIQIRGEKSIFTLQRGGIPRHLRDQYPPDRHELVTLKHALARRSREAVRSLDDFVHNLVPSAFSVRNPYACGGHPKNHPIAPSITPKADHHSVRCCDHSHS